jgi:hypothetical protein
MQLTVRQLHTVQKCYLYTVPGNVHHSLQVPYLPYLGIIPPVHEIPDAVVVLPHGIEGVGHLNKKP